MIKMLRKLFVILLLALLLVPIGCSKDEVVDITRYRTVVIRVPADTYLGQRTPGDPGVASTLQIPRYLYFFTAFTPLNSTTGNTGPQISALRLDQITPDSWISVSDATGTIISYERTIQLPLPDADEMMLYAVASYDPLTDMETLVDQVRSGTVTLDESTVASLQLSSVQADGSSVSIADVYAGNGRLLTDENAVNEPLVCYHVAAKFDVIYNLSDDFRSGGAFAAWRVKTFTLKNQIGKGFYFNPAANSYVAQEALPDYTFTATPGNNFYGRFDLYLFQPIVMEFPWTVTLTDGTDERTLSGTSTATDVSTGYAAYFRLNLTINGIGSDTGNE